MSGKHSGVQSLLRKQYIPRAIYVHCYAHKLNLVISDVTKAVPYLSEFYSIINKIYTYFHKSSVTNEVFKKVQQQLKIGETISGLISNNKQNFFSFKIVRIYPQVLQSKIGLKLGGIVVGYLFNQLSIIIKFYYKV